LDVVREARAAIETSRWNAFRDATLGALVPAPA